MAKKQAGSLSTIYLLINVLVWGAALPIVKFGLPYTTPFRYLTYRYLLAILISLPILFYFLPRVKNLFNKIKIIIVLELIGTTLALGLLYVGLNYSSALETSLIASTTPLLITLGGISFLQEKQEKKEWLGLLIALTGTVLLVSLPYYLGTEVKSVGSLMGNLLIVGQNIATAAYFLLAKRYYKTIPKFFITTISFYVGALTFALLSLLEAQGNLPLLTSSIRNDLQSLSVWFIAFYMAVFGSLIGLTAYIKGQDGIEASEASLFSYLQPFVFIPLSMILLQESLSLMQVVCLVLIGVGVFIAERKR